MYLTTFKTAMQRLVAQVSFALKYIVRFHNTLFTSTTYWGHTNGAVCLTTPTPTKTAIKNFSSWLSGVVVKALFAGLENYLTGHSERIEEHLTRHI